MTEHSVEVDEAAADEVFDAYSQGEYIPADRQLPPPAGGAQEKEPEGQNGWEKPAKFIAGFLNAKVCPNWEVDDDTEQEWAGALAECLDDIFPGGLGNIDNWSPWAKLAFASGTWIMCGVDFETMRFKPLHPPKEADEEEEEVVHGEGDIPAQQTQRPRTSSGFKIG